MELGILQFESHAGSFLVSLGGRLTELVYLIFCLIV